MLTKSGPAFKWTGFQVPLHYACEQIINNAIVFSPHGGLITIESCSAAREIRIRITDRGSGIAAGKEEEHTGTGLSLSMNALRKIGENLYAANNDEAGAVFNIILPAHV